jgi:hypothetical protein
MSINPAGLSQLDIDQRPMRSHMNYIGKDQIMKFSLAQIPVLSHGLISSIVPMDCRE